MTYNRIAGRSLERLSALSDGVFSIAVTLLVLDIRIPEGVAIHGEGDLQHALGLLTPRFTMYFMSFLTLGIFWVGQQTQIDHFARSTRDVAWLHILFLAAVAILPFTTTLLAPFITYRTALLVYWGNVLALGVCLYIGWLYACRAGIVKNDVTAELPRAVLRRILVAQSCMASARRSASSTPIGVSASFSSFSSTTRSGPESGYCPDSDRANLHS